MISLNSTHFPQVLNNHVSVQVATKYSGDFLQHFRHLLRRGKLKGAKNGQIGLVEKSTFEDSVDRARIKPTKALD